MSDQDQLSRLGAEGYGVELAGPFDGKGPAAPPSKPSDLITRLGQFAVMTAKYPGFVAKPPAGGVPFVPLKIQPDLHGHLHSLQGNFQ
jgi:hypothetical protein